MKLFGLLIVWSTLLNLNSSVVYVKAEDADSSDLLLPAHVLLDSNNRNGNRNGNDTDSCSAHQTCSDCTLSSRFCHWCAHDNACHTIGSIYGCMEGVDCYSNERCQRLKPEKIANVDDYRRLSIVPLVAIIILSVWCASVATCCLGMLRTRVRSSSSTTNHAEQVDTLHGPLHQPLLEQQQADENDEQEPANVQEEQVESPADDEEANDNNDGNRDQTNDDAPTTTRPNNASAETSSALLQQEDEEEESAPVMQTVRTFSESNQDAYLRFLHGSATSIDVEEGEEEGDQDYESTSTQNHIVEASTSHRRRRKTPLQTFYTACIGCYAVILLALAVLLATVVLYYPRIPQYNVCNDAVAWKSIMDNLVSLKVSADVELLASVGNPNPFSVVLDMGHGSFQHNGVFVGTFDIPPVTVTPHSITDIMVLAHLSPEHWEALSLTSDYYHGRLVLEIAAVASLRVPTFWNVSYTAHVQDLVVHVSEINDRHLCHCPSWNDSKTAAPLLLELE